MRRFSRLAVNGVCLRACSADLAIVVRFLSDNPRFARLDIACESLSPAIFSWGGFAFLLRSLRRAIVCGMADDEKLTPADPQDLAESSAFALRFSSRKRVHDSDTFMARIAAM